MLYTKLWWQKTSNNHFSGFAMHNFKQNDTSFVFLTHLAPNIYRSLRFSKLRTCIILDFEFRMISKLKNKFQFVCHAEISGKGPLIFTSSSWGSYDTEFYVFINGVGGHFGNQAQAELGPSRHFRKGAYFSLKCFRYSIQSWKKVGT